MKNSPVLSTIVLCLMMSWLMADEPTPQFPPGQGGFWMAGPDGLIFMGFARQLARSDDAGLTWQIVSQLPCQFNDFRLFSDGSIVVTGSRKEQRTGWTRSRDEGKTWSEFTPIPIEWDFRTRNYGPIYEMSDGRWAYAPYAETNKHDRTNSLILWSDDQGTTWSQPIAFPEPIDGNQGKTEVALLEYQPGKLIAALRTDDTDPGGFDGGYFSLSDDGYHWSVPKPIGDRIRQPHFYHIGNVFCLTYRQYAPWDGTGYATVRFSENGTSWSQPFRIRRSVQDGPNLVLSHGKVLAFNTLYPQNDVRTRQEIAIPNPSEWFLSPIRKP